VVRARLCAPFACCRFGLTGRIMPCELPLVALLDGNALRHCASGPYSSCVGSGVPAAVGGAERVAVLRHGGSVLCGRMPCSLLNVSARGRKRALPVARF